MKRKTVYISGVSVVVALGLIAVAVAGYGRRRAGEPLAEQAMADTAPQVEPARYSAPTTLASHAAAELPALDDQPPRRQLPTRDRYPADPPPQVVEAGNPLRGTLVSSPAQSAPPEQEKAAAPAATPTDQAAAPAYAASAALAPPIADAGPPDQPAEMPLQDSDIPDRDAREPDAARYGDVSREPPSAADFGPSSRHGAAGSGTPGESATDNAWPEQPTPAAVEEGRYSASESPAAPENFRAPLDAPARPLEPQPEAWDAGASSTLSASGVPGERQLDGMQTPSLTVEKVAPDEIQVGKEAVFEIRVHNVGRLAAHAVTVVDSVPRGTQFVSANPEPRMAGDGQLLWELGTLGPGEESGIEVHFMPTDVGQIGSVATVQFQVQASVRTQSTRPKLSLSLRHEGARRILIGKQAVIKIELANPGTGAATGVFLLEDVPEQFSHPAGRQLEFEVGTLAPNERREFDLILTAEQAGRAKNVLRARGDAGLETQGEVELEVIAPDLEVTIDGPRRRYLERKAVYTLNVNNPGTALAKDIELTAYLPKGMQFVEANNHGHYDASTHSVVWGLEELPANERGKVTLVTVPTEEGEHKLLARGKASQGLTDETEQTVLVEGLAAIMFEVVDLEDPIEVGGETTYEIRVVNQGSKAATNVRVAAMFPPNLQPVSASGHSQHVLEADHVEFQPLARLAPKADTTYRIKARGLSGGDQRVKVHVVTDEIQTPVTKEVSTRVYADE